MTRLFRLSPLAALALAACVSPAMSGGIEGTEWHLIGIEGMPVSFRATLLVEGDRASGEAPCNRWFATNGAALPALALGAIGATRMACPDLPAEAAYFDALAAMQRAELDQDRLFLIGPEGRVMEFAADPAGAPCLSCGAGP